MLTLLSRIKIYCFIFIVTCAGAQSVQSASSFALTEAQINQYVAGRTIRDNLGLPGLFSVDYKLRNLTARIGQNDPGRVELSGIADTQFKLPNDQFSAKLNLKVDTVPYYDPQQGAIYLKDLRILQLSGLPAQYQTQAQTMLPLMADSIAAMAGNMPIYTLDETDPRQATIKKVAREIKVEPGKLLLETNIF